MKNILLLIGLIVFIGCGKDRGFDRLTTGGAPVQVNRDVIRWYPSYVEVYFYQSHPSSDILEMSLSGKTGIKCYAQVNGIVIPLPTNSVDVSVFGDKVTIIGLKSGFDSVGSVQIAWQ